MSQREAVLERLKVGPLTQFQALRELGIMRLAPRIEELRREHAIDTIMIDVMTANRDRFARVAQYVLKDK